MVDLPARPRVMEELQAASAIGQGKLYPVVILPAEAGRSADEGTLTQLIVAADTFAVDQAVSLTRGQETGVAVLTKLVEQGAGFEIYDFAAIK